MKRLKAIKFINNAYIDLGILANIITEIDFKFYRDSTYNAYDTPIGLVGVNGYGDIKCGAGNSNSAGVTFFRNAKATSGITLKRDKTEMRVYTEDSSVKFDNGSTIQTLYTKGIPVLSSNTSKNLVVGCGNDNYSRAYISEVKITVNGGAVYDFLPYIDDNNQIGLYDYNHDLFKTTTQSALSPEYLPIQVNVTADIDGDGEVSPSEPQTEFSDETISYLCTPSEGKYLKSIKQLKDGVETTIFSTPHATSYIFEYVIPYTEDDIKLTFEFADLVRVNVNSNNPEIGIVSGGGSYVPGSSVTLEATTQELFVFWINRSTNEILSTNGTYTFTISSDIEILAIFDEGDIVKPDAKYVDLSKYNRGVTLWNDTASYLHYLIHLTKAERDSILEEENLNYIKLDMDLVSPSTASSTHCGIIGQNRPVTASNDIYMPTADGTFKKTSGPGSINYEIVPGSVNFVRDKLFNYRLVENHIDGGITRDIYYDGAKRAIVNSYSPDDGSYRSVYDELYTIHQGSFINILKSDIYVSKNQSEEIEPRYKNRLYMKFANGSKSYQWGDAERNRLQSAAQIHPVYIDTGIPKVFETTGTGFGSVELNKTVLNYGDEVEITAKPSEVPGFESELKNTYVAGRKIVDDEILDTILLNATSSPNSFTIPSDGDYDMIYIRVEFKKISGGDKPYEPEEDPGELPSDTIEDSKPTGFLDNPNNSLIEIFVPTDAELKNFGDILFGENWAQNIAYNVLNIGLTDIIHSLCVIPCAIPTEANAKYYKVGWWTTGISMHYTKKNYVEFDCGSLKVDSLYNSYLDYLSNVQIYLPFIGFQSLENYDVINKTLNVKYQIDLVTAECVCKIFVDGSCKYQYKGSAGYSIPLTSNSDISIGLKPIATIMSAGFAASGVPAATLTGAKESVHTKINRGKEGRITSSMTETTKEPSQVETTTYGAAKELIGTFTNMGNGIGRGTGLGGNAGFLSINTPYLVITRPHMIVPDNFGKYNGYPSYKEAKLSSLSGYTEIDTIHLENIPCTLSELEEIETLLKEGVIL